MRYKPDQSYVVIIADVKNFKLINNIYGIRVGDDILRYLAKIMSKALTDGLAARYSDDQFVMFTSIPKNDFEKVFGKCSKVYFRKCTNRQFACKVRCI